MLFINDGYHKFILSTVLILPTSDTVFMSSKKLQEAFTLRKIHVFYTHIHALMRQVKLSKHCKAHLWIHTFMEAQTCRCKAKTKYRKMAYLYEYS